MGTDLESINDDTHDEAPVISPVGVLASEGDTLMSAVGDRPSQHIVDISPLSASKSSWTPSYSVTTTGSKCPDSSGQDGLEKLSRATESRGQFEDAVKGSRYPTEDEPVDSGYTPEAEDATASEVFATEPTVRDLTPGQVTDHSLARDEQLLAQTADLVKEPGDVLENESHITAVVRHSNYPAFVRLIVGTADFNTRGISLECSSRTREGIATSPRSR